MARNFSKMTNDELNSLIGSASQLKELSSSELNQLSRTAKAAGVLGVENENILAIYLNSKAYEDILASDKYTKEEKVEALGYLKEYNAEIIKSRAKVVDGKYHFDYLTKGEMDTLMESGALSFNDIKLAQTYKIGQEADRDFSKEITPIAKETAPAISALATAAVARETVAVSRAPFAPALGSNLPTDLQKAYDFWNKFNEKTEQTGVKYQVDNMENKHLLVEAKKGEQTLFKGIDHGAKGFDIVKRDKSAEPYELFDALVKKAKAGNPKTVIRIKDNVTDAVLRNKILIACAKNKMEPVGNLPQGFDFIQLQNMVAGLNTTEEINALAHSLYAPEEFAFGQENAAPEKEEKILVAPVVINQANKGNTPVAPTTKEPEKKPIVGGVVVAPISGGNSGNGSNGGKIPVAPASQNQGKSGSTTILYKPTPRPFWKKVRDAVIIGGLGLLTWIGLKNNKDIKDAKQDTIGAVDRMAAQNCEAYTKLVDENSGLRKDNKLLQEAVDDCGKVKPVKNTPRKIIKKIPVKTPVVAPVKPAPVVIKGDTIYEPDVHIPGKVIQDPDIHIPGKVIVDPAPTAKPVVTRTPPAPQATPAKKPRRGISFEPQHGLDNDLNQNILPTKKNTTAAASVGEQETVDLLSQADKDAIVKGKTISFARAMRDGYGS